MKTLFHSGLRVLYSVCVWSRALTSSNTQNGSLFPPMSAASKPWARITAKLSNIKHSTRTARDHRFKSQQRNYLSILKLLLIFVLENSVKPCINLNLECTYKHMRVIHMYNFNRKQSALTPLTDHNCSPFTWSHPMSFRFLKELIIPWNINSNEIIYM